MQIMCSATYSLLAVADERFTAGVSHKGGIESEDLAAGERRHPKVFVRPEWEGSTFWKINENEKSIKKIDQPRASRGM